MIFSELITDLQTELKKNMPQIRFLLKKNPGMGSWYIPNQIPSKEKPRYGIYQDCRNWKRGRKKIQN